MQKQRESNQLIMNYFNQKIWFPIRVLLKGIFKKEIGFLKNNLLFNQMIILNRELLIVVYFKRFNRNWKLKIFRVNQEKKLIKR